MNLIVDLHLHSHYSRATSKNMDLEHLYLWGKIKGINVIGTGDFTHPIWLNELQEKLEPAEPGLFALKPEIAQKIDLQVPVSCRNNLLRFILTSEISNIYSKNDKVRKLHNIIIAPSLSAVASLNGKLNKIGNLKADGRPILGLDSKELLRLSLETDPDNFFIPAHVWTPWFALFGSKSGFDSIKEAFEDLSPYIKAMETGLSSDPFMNWRWSELDHITLVSNSDAHSPKKLGREANILNCELNYFKIIEAIKTGDDRFIGTIEFFPQEGKYHYDGHRSCDVCFSPSESIKHKLLCPKCGKPLVLGVDYRIEQLVNRPHNFKPKKHKKVEYIIPLAEILAELNNLKSANGKKVQQQYFEVINKLGDEFNILRLVKLEKIKKLGYTKLAEAIRRLRKKQVHLKPGFDGVYGEVKVFANKQELQQFDGQLGLGI